MSKYWNKKKNSFVYQSWSKKSKQNQKKTIKICCLYKILMTKEKNLFEFFGLFFKAISDSNCKKQQLIC